MIITYFGLGAVKIETNKTSLLIDPFQIDSGLKPLRGKFETILLSRVGGKLPGGLMNHPFVIDTPGEYDLKGISLVGLANNQQIIYSLTAEGINLVHLTNIKQALSNGELDLLGEVGVFFFPIGGGETLDNEAAGKLVSQIEPYIVVPIYYNLAGLKIKLADLNRFTQEMGVKNSSPQEKLKLKKKDLSSEQTKIIFL